MKRTILMNCDCEDLECCDFCCDEPDGMESTLAGVYDLIEWANSFNFNGLAREENGRIQTATE